MWDDIGEPKDSEMRVMDPAFAEVCEDFSPNDQVELPPNGGSESKKDAPGG